MPNDGEDLPSTASVMRFVPDKKKELPVNLFSPMTERRPAASAFDLSSKDKESVPPRLSVWDLSVTTVAQARAHRPPSSEVATPYSLAVSDILGEAQALELTCVRVVYDRLSPPSGLPGEHGHSGIEGLQAKKGENRMPHQTLKAKLAHKCRAIE